MLLRSSVIGIGLAVTALLAFQVGGCSSGGGGTGGSSGTGKGGSAGSSSPGTGGTSAGMAGSSAPGTGGSTAGTGGSATGTGGTATGTGGTATGTGGTATGTGGTATGTGGSGTAGTGGSGTAGTGGSGTAGTGGSGTAGTGGSGTAGAGGSTSGFGQPACAGTVSKGSACMSTDVQLCYKNCGPQNIGRKSETCGPGADGGMVYAEMSGCSYDPAGNFACYKIPTTANTACPAGVPMGSASCALTDPCVVCNDMGGVAGGMYMDSTSMKTGFCVCVANKWTCASNTAWPCGGTPVANNPGCQ